MSIEDKRAKVKSNYDTIEALRFRLDEIKKQERVGMTRAAYIKMIFDVTKKVDTQNDELSKAILDTRRLQRDISSLEGRLERSLKLVEEAILKVGLNQSAGFVDPPSNFYLIPLFNTLTNNLCHCPQMTITQDAKSDVWSQECYRLLGRMHKNCDQLIQAVQESGELAREIRQLEDQIGQAQLVNY